MARLSEDMIFARTKQSNLTLIKKFNCCGGGLIDISIVRRMPALEILSLSVNKIRNLKPFEDCKKLQELYLRSNDIRDINEIGYLRNLPDLKLLWLAENPCVEAVGPNYRKIVLRTLPRLSKLDNIEVTSDEVILALRGYDTNEVPDKERRQVETKFNGAFEEKQLSYRQPSIDREFQRNDFSERTSLPLNKSTPLMKNTETELKNDWKPNSMKRRRYAAPQKNITPNISNTRRSTNRSSNLLSATLCLVNELDYTSLDVVQHTIRCRIDELGQE